MESTLHPIRNKHGDHVMLNLHRKS